MSPRRFPAALALAVWSLLIWTTRIRNIWADGALSTGDQWGRTALALSFTLLALVVGYGVVRRAEWRRPGVLALGGWTVAVWVVRSIGIATADHDAAFIVVHLALAVISIALAAMAVSQERAAADLSSG